MVHSSSVGLPTVETERSMKKVLLLVVPIFAVCAGAARADSLPNYKAGLWESSTKISGLASSMAGKFCLDGNSDELALNQFMNNPHSKCAAPVIKGSGSRYTIDTECTMMGSKVSSNTVLEGDFNAQYTATVTTKFDPPMPGAPKDPVVMAMKWVGPCPAGMKPGDMEMNGQRITAEQVAASAKQAQEMMDSPEMQKAMEMARKAMQQPQ